MKNVDDAMPRRWTIDPFDGRWSRVVFATSRPRGAQVLMEPSGDTTGPTVRFVPR